MLSDVEQWRIHHLSKERGHKIDLGALGGGGGRKEDQPAGGDNNKMQPAGVAHHLHDHHSGGGGITPGLSSSRREPSRSYFAQHEGAWCQMEEGVAKSSNE